MRRIRDVVANREFYSAAGVQSVLDAAKLMASKNVGSILVMNGQQLEGILTERDILTRIVAMGRDPEAVKVAEIMTRNPVVMSPDKPFRHALMAMAEGGFRHMPVVEGFDVVGVVSMRDAIGVEHEEMDRMTHALDSIASRASSGSRTNERWEERL